MDSKFFKFAEPLLTFIDKGDFFRKPFRVLYMIMAVLSIIMPLVYIWRMVDDKMFSGPGKIVVGLILFLLVLCFAHWIMFQIWWSRKDKVNQVKNENDEFVSTPVFAHFIQTSGEAMGVFFGIVGAGFSLVATIFFGDAASAISRSVAISANDYGILGIVIFPVFGFLIVVFSRFIAEQVKALTTIANNTRK